MEPNTMERSPQELRREAAKAIASYLCQPCRGIVTNWRRWSLERFSGSLKVVHCEHHKTVRELLIASAASCGICTAIEARLKERSGSVWKFFEHFRAGSTPLHMRHDSLAFCYKQLTIPYPIIFVQTLVPDASLDMYANLAEKFTGHFNVLERGRMWYDMCLDSHDTCAQRQRTEYYPPRVLVIEGSQRMRLVDSEYLDPGYRYATLSYCWGRAPRHLKLTPRTEKALRAGVDTACLAATFIDAMKVCTHLQIKLIWIDSLCIMQEGPRRASDWQAHITEMCSIYENCSLNISADHGENAEAGCFLFRDPDRIRPIFCEQDGDEEEERLTVVYSTSFWHSSIESSALMRRGWVHQERLLSPRVLRFGASQLFWECGQLSACETLPMGGFEEWYTDTSSSRFRKNQDSSWNRIVEDFTRAELTVASDRLPAIGGIAERLSRQNNMEYLAGLFKDSLPHALLWKRADRWLVRLDSPYIAPTWSWASCDGAVDFKLMYGAANRTDTKCKVVEVDLAYVSAANPFGQLLRGSLTLSGSMLNGMRNDNDFVLHDANERWGYVEVPADGGGGEKNSAEENDEDRCEIYATFDESAVMQTREHLIYLVVIDQTDDFGPWELFCGLIVKPTGNQTDAKRFVRMGVFHVRNRQFLHPLTKPARFKMITMTLV